MPVLRDVEGSATYEGGSVGVYVKDVLDDQANIVSSTSGHFSADVDLTATFGGDDVTANNKFTIGGKITGFVLQYGEANDWAVGLGLADFSDSRVEGGDPGKSAPGDNGSRMCSTVWLQGTARLPLVRGMESSTVPRRHFDHDDVEYDARYQSSAGRRGWRVQRQLLGRNRGRWVRRQHKEVDLVRQIGFSL